MPAEAGIQSASWDDPFTRSSRVNPKGTAAKSGRAGSSAFAGMTT